MAEQTSRTFGSAISRRGFITGLGATAALIASGSLVEAANSFHIVIYGGTSAGVIAACAAARDNLRVALIIGPNPIGGMTANGLSKSDLGSTGRVGGLTERFFTTLGRHYGIPVANHFEPHVAEGLFRSWLGESGCTVYDRDIAEVRGAVMDGNRIRVLRLADGTVIGGRVFIDCSYEGDLMAQAGVAHDVGRDADTTYSESMAGFGKGFRYSSIRARNAQGQLIPGVKPYPRLAIGARDAGVMGYNFRLSLTSDPAERVPFAAPPGYNPDLYAIDLAKRWRSFHPGGALSVAPTKYDRNDDEYIGENWLYPKSSRAVRAKIVAAHKTYQAGRLYFLANDPRVPAECREMAQLYGLSGSEFGDNGHWPRQIYIREARRMRGMYKMKQQNAVDPVTFPDPAFMWSYGLDSHFVQRLEAPDGGILSEGSFGASGPPTKIWRMPLRALLPIRSNCINLIVPVCASITRVFATCYRMEPSYMMAGEAAAVLATVAVREHCHVQDVDRPALSRKLAGLGAKL
ncbi:FAD-dependent oxidoreductase [Methylobrevis albus]|uniref:FAD-dependent oxidoreductase n=1 Tax=Methylobrevis albus TaxID=2793297 RepID=A0A931HYR0_9HYPH|nr:FAD-dependent oxidoreductase [Methylobrevis albus]MBH0236775.1 FAD-dependent oxidoreductase [Methylobrevis albus]